MGRAAFIAGLAVLASAAPVAASAATAVATARVTIVEGNVVRIDWTLAMPSVRGAVTGGAAFTGATPSARPGTTTLSRRRPATRREDAGATPLTAPASFEVVTLGGQDTVIVRTAPGAEVSLTSVGAIAGGAVQGAAAASIDVARGLLPLPASGRTLAIVVQYN